MRGYRSASLIPACRGVGPRCPQMLQSFHSLSCRTGVMDVEARITAERKRRWPRKSQRPVKQQLSRNGKRRHRKGRKQPRQPNRLARPRRARHAQPSRRSASKKERILELCAGKREPRSPTSLRQRSGRTTRSADSSAERLPKRWDSPWNRRRTKEARELTASLSNIPASPKQKKPPSIKGRLCFFSFRFTRQLGGFVNSAAFSG